MTKPFVLGHLSDPHLGSLPWPTVRELASKRLFGYINWQRERRLVHLAHALDTITRDLHDAKPDHIAVTGDLVNVALPDEFAHARRWLEALGDPDHVSVVPGNHDAYVPSAAVHRNTHWLAYMTGDDTAVTSGPNNTEILFPYVRRRGPVALVGISSAVPTAPLMATGKVGTPQIAKLEMILETLRNDGLFRVVMIHHPPLPAAHHKCLTDAVAFQHALAQAGAELVIHGHDHVHSLNAIPGRDGARIPVIGAPSASASATAKRHPGGYNLYLITGRPGAWSCEVVSRDLSPSGPVAELKRHALSWRA